MIIVVSNIANEAAAQLVDMFPPGAASLVTASNFHQSFRAGINVNHFDSSRLTINGLSLGVNQITGVITTVAGFLPPEFYYIEPADRKYICAEMNAFFIYFLSQLNCKKVNPPSVTSFSGISMHKIEWIKKVSALHIPVWPANMINSKPVNPADNDKTTFSRYTCSVLNNKIIGEQPPAPLRDYVHDLQKLFDLPFFTAHFISNSPGKYYLGDVTSLPDISKAANREAIVNYFHKPV